MKTAGDIVTWTGNWRVRNFFKVLGPDGSGGLEMRLIHDGVPRAGRNFRRVFYTERSGVRLATQEEMVQLALALFME